MVRHNVSSGNNRWVGDGISNTKLRAMSQLTIIRNSTSTPVRTMGALWVCRSKVNPTPGLFKTPLVLMAYGPR